MASTIRVRPADNGTDRFAADAYSASGGQMIAVVPPGGGRVYGDLIAVEVAADGSAATLTLDTGDARTRTDLDQLEITRP